MADKRTRTPTPHPVKWHRLPGAKTWNFKSCTGRGVPGNLKIWRTKSCHPPNELRADAISPASAPKLLKINMTGGHSDGVLDVDYNITARTGNNGVISCSAVDKIGDRASCQFIITVAAD